MTSRPTSSAAGHRRAGEGAADRERAAGQVQEAEINRREKELIATVLKGAEITKKKKKKKKTHRDAGGGRKAAPDRGEAKDDASFDPPPLRRGRTEIIFKKEKASRSQGLNVKASLSQDTTRRRYPTTVCHHAGSV